MEGTWLSRVYVIAFNERTNSISYLLHFFIICECEYQSVCRNEGLGSCLVERGWDDEEEKGKGSGSGNGSGSVVVLGVVVLGVVALGMVVPGVVVLGVVERDRQGQQADNRENIYGIYTHINTYAYLYIKRERKQVKVNTKNNEGDLRAV